MGVAICSSVIVVSETKGKVIARGKLKAAALLAADGNGFFSQRGAGLQIRSPECVSSLRHPPLEKKHGCYNETSGWGKRDKNCGNESLGVALRKCGRLAATLALPLALAGASPTGCEPSSAHSRWQSSTEKNTSTWKIQDSAVFSF